MSHDPTCRCGACFLANANGWRDVPLTSDPLARAIAHDLDAAPLHPHPIMQDAHWAWHQVVADRNLTLRVYVLPHAVYASEPYLYDGKTKTFLGVR